MITGRKVMVTGAGGFIGGHIARKLAKDGENVVGIDIAPFSDEMRAYPNLNCIQADIRDASAISAAMVGSGCGVSSSRDGICTRVIRRSFQMYGC